ncbi:MAG TPA: TetR/AcrR family transcriptional regulator [Anaerolineales bacterium]|nr:TetR/AcrR family transcriptional regulator [Anaerolineales bacterium]
MPQQRGEETRGRILDAAVRKFAIAGYDAASVDDICAEAGVSKGAFYHHFPSKQAVFLALMNGWLSMINMGIDAVHKDTVPETLVEMTNLLPGVFAAAEDRMPMFLEFWLQASRDEKIWQAVIAPYRHYQERFTKLVQEGIAEGSLKPVEPQIAAQVIVSLAVGLVLQGVLDPHSADWAKVAEQSMQILMNGLAKN